MSIALLLAVCSVGTSAVSDITCNHESAQTADMATALDSQSEQPYGLLCSLFGHNYEYTETKMELQHRLRVTVPYCDKVTYIVYTCSRCGAIEFEETNRTASYCCS